MSIDQEQYKFIDEALNKKFTKFQMEHKIEVEPPLSNQNVLST